MTHTRLDPDARADQLLDVALDLAASTGWATLTHAAVAARAGVSQGLVVARLGTKPDMLRSVMRRAVLRDNVRVVAEGLARGDRHARRASPALREAAAKLMTSGG
jgi:AcrR family transcriptional regulator